MISREAAAYITIALILLVLWLAAKAERLKEELEDLKKKKANEG